MKSQALYFPTFPQAAFTQLLALQIVTCKLVFSKLLEFSVLMANTDKVWQHFVAKHLVLSKYHRNRIYAIDSARFIDANFSLTSFHNHKAKFLHGGNCSTLSHQLLPWQQTSGDNLHSFISSNPECTACGVRWTLVIGQMISVVPNKLVRWGRRFAKDHM